MDHFTIKQPFQLPWNRPLLAGIPSTVRQLSPALCQLWVLAGMAGFEPADDGVKGRCLTAWRHPCIGGTGRIRTHARLSPPISFQDCSLMTTWVLFQMVAPCRFTTPAQHFPSFRAAIGRRKKNEYGRLWHPFGAGDGNRTRVTCLEGRCSTIELHRRVRPGQRMNDAPGLPVFPGCQKQKEEDQCAGHCCTRVEPGAGLEPTACWLQISCSTD